MKLKEEARAHGGCKANEKKIHTHIVTQIGEESILYMLSE
jgi:hypothetical protein